MAKRFTSEDGLVTADMIQSGLDHLGAAEVLFNSKAGHLDAAGYLAHMAVELLLKGWLLQADGGFDATHNLHNLAERLRTLGHLGELQPDSDSTLDLLNEFEELRYPNRNKPVEIGQNHWKGIEMLVEEIYQAMPAEIPEELQKLDPTRKGGRVLMKRKIDHQE